MAAGADENREIIRKGKWYGRKKSERLDKRKKKRNTENGQWTMLKAYILLTTAYRKAELENWKKMASEHEGNPQDDPDELSELTEFAEENAEFWKSMDEVLDLIEMKI